MKFEGHYEINDAGLQFTNFSKNFNYDRLM